jgi:DNA-binding beta-propeller fold protein YncE
VLPELEALEKAFPSALVVIGVHSAKFPNEREAASIHQAILRHGLGHPVVNDDQFTIWRSYAIRGWPTLVLIDPEGYVIATLVGEGHGDRLRTMIAKLIRLHGAKGTLKEGPPRFHRERMPETLLAFPGKVLADAATGRLFIADTGHHRIVITDFTGAIRDLAGGETPGGTDGPFARASFRSPQGLAIAGSALYVADTENHLIRRLDLESRTVETVAGTGQQGPAIRGSGAAHEMALNSPWDICITGGQLYIAMAGCHQIWVMDLATARMELFAGTGLEQMIDGPRLEGALAQPSGLATDGERLYIADSEVSAIRSIEVSGHNLLRTHVGQGLFVFGDRDGIGPEVRLQHPLGVACGGAQIYVADTYNHKIKMLYPIIGAVKTLFGTGRPGPQDGQNAAFFEPSGLSVVEDKIYIADTNNHRIRIADLISGEVSTLEMRLVPSSKDRHAPGNFPGRD